MADPIVDELVAIKKLLIKGLMHNGMSQEAVAEALGTNQSTVSRMFTKRPSREQKKENGSSQDNVEAGDVEQ